MSEEIETSSNEIEEVQQEANKPKGYLSPDEWAKAGKDPDEYKGWKAYEKDGEMIKYIQHQNKTVAELKKTVENLNTHFSKVEEVTRKKTIEEMKQQLYDAAQMADSSKVMDLQQKISTAERETPVAQVQPNQTDLLRQFGTAFKQANPEICNDPDMFDYARKTEQMLLSTRPDLHPSELYTHVKAKVEEKYKPPKQNVSAVFDGGNTETTKNFSKKVDGYDSLDPFYKKDFNRLKQQLGDKFNAKEYIAQSLQVQALESK